MDENMTNLQNEDTKRKNIELEKLNDLLAKESHESVLNYKLSLRKKKIFNYIMESRMKNVDKNNDNNKINNRKKYYEYKKLFEIGKIKETLDKLFLKTENANYMKDKKIIELIHLYSRNINTNDNVKNIFEINIEKLIEKFLYEIINDIKSQSINFELFDYYLIILGNLFIYKKSIYDNKNNEYLSLFLNILNMNSNLEIYNDYNFEIINNALWLIYLYIYFGDKNNISIFPFIIKTVNNLFINRFFEELIKFSNTDKKKEINLGIIKEIIYSGIKIYLSIFENLIENNKKDKININMQKEDIQHCFDILIKMIDFNLLKDVFNEDITYIISLILELSGNIFTLNLVQFYNIYINLFEKYKNYDYDNNGISQNLISILYCLIDKYYEDNYFFQILNDSNVIQICIQYYLQNGSIINIVLSAINMIFKYPFNYHKIIIKSINYQLLNKVCEILINTVNKEDIFYRCLNILINAYFFLENNMKNNYNENILRYFDLKIIPKIEQLMLHNDNYICEIASFLYKKFKNIEI